MEDGTDKGLCRSRRGRCRAANVCAVDAWEVMNSTALGDTGTAGHMGRERGRRSRFECLAASSLMATQARMAVIQNEMMCWLRRIWQQ
jgi:hypothetical protein